MILTINSIFKKSASEIKQISFFFDCASIVQRKYRQNYYKCKHLKRLLVESIFRFSFKNQTKLLPNHYFAQKSIVDCYTQYLFSKMSRMKAPTHWQSLTVNKKQPLFSFEKYLSIITIQMQKMWKYINDYLGSSPSSRLFDGFEVAGTFSHARMLIL